MNELEEKYAQHMEIKLEDMSFVVEALMRVGYQVLCQQDGESMDWVMIDYVNREHSGHWFEECEE